MKAQRIDKLSSARKLLLSVGAAVTLAAPVVVGVLTAPPARAQTATAGFATPGSLKVSIRTIPKDALDRGATLPGSMHFPTLRSFIAEAYGVSEVQVVGQKWNDETWYNVLLEGLPRLITPTEQDLEQRQAQIRASMREVLTKSFGLVTSSGQKQMKGYVLLTSAEGPKLEIWSRGRSYSLRPKDGSSLFIGVEVPEMTRLLSSILGVPVVDQTGIYGRFNLTLDLGRRSPESAPDLATVSAALERVGLHLEARPVTVKVINVLNLIQTAGQ